MSNTTPRESTVETALRRAAEDRGLVCWKFTTPAVAGVPDRILLGHHSLTGKPVTVFIEVKRPGGRLRALQRARIDQMVAAGALVAVVDGHQPHDDILDEFFGPRTDNPTTPQPGLCIEAFKASTTSMHTPTSDASRTGFRPINPHDGLPPI